jgi:acetyl esterase/lipase
MKIDEKIDEMRESYLNNPVLLSVDTFKQTIGDHVEYRIETNSIISEPLDESYIKQNAGYTFTPSTNLFKSDLNVTIEHDSVFMQRYSPSGNHKAVLRATAEGMVIQVYTQGALAIKKLVPFTTHLLFVKSPVFMTENIIWSSDESRFMYMAEDPAPGLNLFKLKEHGINRYKFQDSLGDRLSGHPTPSIIIFDLKLKEPLKLLKPPSTPTVKTVYLNPQFADPSGHSIVCSSLNMVGARDLAFHTNYPRRLEYFKGLQSDNAITAVLNIKFLNPIPSLPVRDGIVEEVAFLPRVCPDFKRVSYYFDLQCDVLGINSHGLRVMDLETFSTRTLIDNVEEDGEEFAGINGIHAVLSKYCWVNSGAILFYSYHHQSSRIYEVDVETKVVRKVGQVKILESEAHAILGKLDTNLILAKRDCVYRNNLLFILTRTPSGPYLETPLSNLPFSPPFPLFSETPTINGIECTFYGKHPSSLPDPARPMILLLHGGPHSCWPNVYNPLLDYFIRRDYTVLNINYTGSTGRGSKFAKGLLGRNTEVEVKEVYDCIRYMVDSKRCDPERVHILSGSYGGFITLFLMKNYPNLLRSASLFNPVCNVLSMHGQSSASNWVNGEILGLPDTHYDQDTPTDAQLLKMKSASPLFSDFTSTTEVLLFVGLKDEVVPPGPARTLFKTLRKQGVKTALFEYPKEEHLIALIDANFDYCVKSLLLFSGEYPF